MEPRASESSVDVGAEGLIGAQEWGVNRRRRGSEGVIPSGCRSEGFIGSFMFFLGFPRFTGPPQKTRRPGGRRVQSGRDPAYCWAKNLPISPPILKTNIKSARLAENISDSPPS